MAGMMVIARNSELKIARITLIAIAPTNSPAGPGIKAIGAKVSAVVIVEPRSGSASNRTLRETAAAGLSPSRNAFEVSSTMTIALSISKPNAIINPVTDIW